MVISIGDSKGGDRMNTYLFSNYFTFWTIYLQCIGLNQCGFGAHAAYEATQTIFSHKYLTISTFLVECSKTLEDFVHSFSFCLFPFNFVGLEGGFRVFLPFVKSSKWTDRWGNGQLCLFYYLLIEYCGQ